jgi:hypothetical protein
MVIAQFMGVIWCEGVSVAHVHCESLGVKEGMHLVFSYVTSIDSFVGAICFMCMLGVTSF